MRQQWIISIVLGALLSLMISVTAHAQSVSLPSLVGSESEEQPDVASENFQSSLNDVINMLESEDQRRALLDSLRELQLSAEAVEEEGVVRQGLLGALADTLSDIGEQAQCRGFAHRRVVSTAGAGVEDLRALNAGADQRDAVRAVAEGALLAVIWSGLLVAMIAFGRVVAKRRHWPLDLPRTPRPGCWRSTSCGACCPGLWLSSLH